MYELLFILSHIGLGCVLAHHALGGDRSAAWTDVVGVLSAIICFGLWHYEYISVRVDMWFLRPQFYNSIVIGSAFGGALRGLEMWKDRLPR